MPEKETIEKAQEDLREHKSPSTAAGEFVREEMHHVREGKHGVANTKQAIAIGLSKARRAGVPLAPQPGGGSPDRKASAAPSTKRSRATTRALEREPHVGASRQALSKQAKSSARKRGRASRQASARKAARTRKQTRGRA